MEFYIDCRVLHTAPRHVLEGVYAQLYVPEGRFVGSSSWVERGL